VEYLKEIGKVGTVAKIKDKLVNYGMIEYQWLQQCQLHSLHSLLSKKNETHIDISFEVKNCTILWMENV
jgi:hypothetical protein